jgi:hypothetical protein
LPCFSELRDPSVSAVGLSKSFGRKRSRFSSAFPSNGPPFCIGHHYHHNHTSNKPRSATRPHGAAMSLELVDEDNGTTAGPAPARGDARYQWGHRRVDPERRRSIAYGMLWKKSAPRTATSTSKRSTRRFSARPTVPNHRFARNEPEENRVAQRLLLRDEGPEGFARGEPMVCRRSPTPV